MQYWTATLRRQMRWQGETGLDEVSIYTPDWYRKTLALDSDFADVFESVSQNFAKRGWDVDAIRQRVRDPHKRT